MFTSVLLTALILGCGNCSVVVVEIAIDIDASIGYSLADLFPRFVHVLPHIVSLSGWQLVVVYYAVDIHEWHEDERQLGQQILQLVVLVDVCQYSGD